MIRTNGPGRNALKREEKMTVPTKIQTWQMVQPFSKDRETGEVVPGSGRKHHVVQWTGMKITFDEHGHLTSVSVP